MLCFIHFGDGVHNLHLLEFDCLVIGDNIHHSWAAMYLMDFVKFVIFFILKPFFSPLKGYMCTL
jgi:hypothetical protein